MEKGPRRGNKQRQNEVTLEQGGTFAQDYWCPHEKRELGHREVLAEMTMEAEIREMCPQMPGAT